MANTRRHMSSWFGSSECRARRNGSIFVVIGLFVDRSRAANPSYSLEPWFNKVSPVLYLASVVVAITQIVLVAYEAAK